MTQNHYEQPTEDASKTVNGLHSQEGTNLAQASSNLHEEVTAEFQKLGHGNVEKGAQSMAGTEYLKKVGQDLTKAGLLPDMALENVHQGYMQGVVDSNGNITQKSINGYLHPPGFSPDFTHTAQSAHDPLSTMFANALSNIVTKDGTNQEGFLGIGGTKGINTSDVTKMLVQHEAWAHNQAQLAPMFQKMDNGRTLAENLDSLRSSDPPDGNLSKDNVQSLLNSGDMLNKDFSKTSTGTFLTKLLNTMNNKPGGLDLLDKNGQQMTGMWPGGLTTDDLARTVGIPTVPNAGSESAYNKLAASFEYHRQLDGSLANGTKDLQQSTGVGADMVGNTLQQVGHAVKSASDDIASSLGVAVKEETAQTRLHLVHGGAVQSGGSYWDTAKQIIATVSGDQNPSNEEIAKVTATLQSIDKPKDPSLVSSGQQLVTEQNAAKLLYDMQHKDDIHLSAAYSSAASAG